MSKCIRWIIALIGLTLAQQLGLHAQSITISPQNSSVAVTKTLQFSAQVTGISNTAVTWYVNGLQGGSAAAGTISAGGLYTAPAKLPPQNPVQVTARCQAKPSVSGSAWVTIQPAAPVIVSVSPNPLPVGTITLTIKGSGFLPGATVFDSYGTISEQLTTLSVSPTSLTAVGYQGPATSAALKVKNPGSAYSNTLTVPVGSPPSNYTLTVVNGSGGGTYTAGATVTITAKAPPAGQVFTGWTGATVKNPAAATTTLTMPAANTTVTANYAPTYALTVVNGTGSGNYLAGTVVTITANTPPAGQVFTTWTGATVSNAKASTTTITMTAAATTVTANYAKTYVLTVVNGTGSGNYQAGTVVTITANAPPAGQVFTTWTGATVANPAASTTTITVPAAAATVTANYAKTYALTVVNGTGSGNYQAGTVVAITANAPPAGQQFVNWTGATVTNPAASTTTITVPAAAATVTANYAKTYALTVVNGTGGGNYLAGAIVTITANAPPAGQQFLNWTGATVANPTASTTTITVPAAATTVTANFAASGPNVYALTVVNGTGSGNYAAGAVVSITANTPPAGQQFVDWTGATVTNQIASTTTITMSAAATTVTANFAPIQGGNIPFPVTSHPRLWITTNDLPRLQSWAVATNPIYQNGMVPLLQEAYNEYNTQFFPGGFANLLYPDPGDSQGYTGLQSEQVAAILAFNSLIDPSPTSRIQYAKAARNILMYALNLAALGHVPLAPFQDPTFAIYNRANAAGEQWPLIVDWIYNATDAQGNAILSSADKATIRNAFMIWANDCINASTEGNDHPRPIGTVNSLALLPGNAAYRFASNNYYISHARLLTMMALCIDPVDDPVVNPTLPGATLGNTLRSYIPNATGAWLYQEFAMMGDPGTVASAYGIPGSGSGLGIASGGLPPEGMLYGHSFGFMLGQLLALQTAGFNNPAYSGPQIGLIGAPVWDRYAQGLLSSLTPVSQTFPAMAYLGPVTQYGSYGDLLRLWCTPDFMQPLSLLALIEKQNGSTAHQAEASWFVVNAVEGGPSALLSRVSNPWSYGSEASILYFLLLDPTQAAAPDPRPAYPTVFLDAPASRIVAHSDWTPSGTMFDYRASWNSIDHQNGDGGQFEMYRNGEWLTKEMSNYDSNYDGVTTYFHNTLALQNWCQSGLPNLNWFEADEWTNGSQWILGMNAGDPTTATSNGAGYVYAASNLTNLYNRPNIYSPSLAAVSIAQATRSILWLNSDYIVIYDRATSLNTGLFKRFNLSLVTNPTIVGNVATETMADGQQLYIQTLLPKAPTITSVYAVGILNPAALLEPTQYVLTVQDSTLPTDTRFLHVLQGANPGAPMAQAAYLTSSSGTPFDGAVFGGTAVYFPVTTTSQFETTTFSAPAGVQTMYITGLDAGTSYGVTTLAVGGGYTVTVIPGGVGAVTDSAGLLKVSLTP